MHIVLAGDFTSARDSDSFQDEKIHIIRDVRGTFRLPLPAPETLGMDFTAGPFPDHILEFAATSCRADIIGRDSNVKQLWLMMLNFWFKREQGFRIESDYDLKRNRQPPSGARAANRDDTSTSNLFGFDHLTYAVLRPASADTPLAVVQVFPESGYEIEESREWANEVMVEAFDVLVANRTQRGSKRILVITAFGRHWSASYRSVYSRRPEQRNPNLVFSVPSDDEEVEWMEDVVDEVSFEILDRLTAKAKESILTYFSGGMEPILDKWLSPSL